jgi:hypothetical protein
VKNLLKNQAHIKLEIVLKSQVKQMLILEEELQYQQELQEQQPQLLKPNQGQQHLPQLALVQLH